MLVETFVLLFVFTLVLAFVFVLFEVTVDVVVVVLVILESSAHSKGDTSASATNSIAMSRNCFITVASPRCD